MELKETRIAESIGYPSEVHTGSSTSTLLIRNRTRLRGRLRNG